jgi:diadenosine tetraphosphate (Ap4A) HIT family hydrolase/predicted house-cleaning noncanonical NTP pyrophosphatase (MazG superfamily)
MVKRFRVEKLVRDGIPELLKGQGLAMHNRILEGGEFDIKLKDKLLEEALEVQETSSKLELVEELADVLEVVRAIASLHDIAESDLEIVRQEKRAKRGGFEKRIYNHHIDVEETNPTIHYFDDRKMQNPEIPIDSAEPGSCLFCQIAKKERPTSIVAEFKHCFVMQDEFPVSKGHLLIIPNEHTENWFTAREEVKRDMVRALSAMKIHLDREYAPSGYNFGANCGKAAGQSIFHLHLHLIPRYDEDTDAPKGGVRGVIPGKQSY